MPAPLKWKTKILLFKTDVTLTDSELEQAIIESHAAMASGDDWP